MDLDIGRRPNEYFCQGKSTKFKLFDEVRIKGGWDRYYVAGIDHGIQRWPDGVWTSYSLYRLLSKEDHPDAAHKLVSPVRENDLRRVSQDKIPKFMWDIQ